MHSYVEAVEPNIIVTAIKKAEDENGLVIRLYDSTGMGGPAHLRIPAGATQVSGELMTEQGADTDVQASLGHDQVTLHLKSFQIVTLLIRYPVSTTN
jgi:alpha-mannosidase